MFFCILRIHIWWRCPASLLYIGNDSFSLLFNKSHWKNIVDFFIHFCCYSSLFLQKKKRNSDYHFGIQHKVLVYLIYIFSLVKSFFHRLCPTIGSWVSRKDKGGYPSRFLDDKKPTDNVFSKHNCPCPASFLVAGLATL